MLDVSSAPGRALYELYVEGAYVTARRVGPSVRLVTTGSLRAPLLKFYPEDPAAWRNEAAWRAALEDIRLANAARIRAHPMEEWLPRMVEAFDGGAPRALGVECGQYRATSGPVALGWSTVSTIHLGRLADGARHTSILNRDRRGVRLAGRAVRHAGPLVEAGHRRRRAHLRPRIRHRVGPTARPLRRFRRRPGPAPEPVLDG